MKEIDGLLNEMAVMLGRWSLYSRFLADKCKVGSLTDAASRRCRTLTWIQDPATNGNVDDGEQFQLPGFLVQSPLSRKVNDRLVMPFNVMTTFFLRRSVEKAFQLDEQPSDLTLNPRKPLQSNPPHITSAVDDIMYIVNKVLQQSLATSQRVVVTSVVPTLARVLGSDFIGMIQRKMRDESYPKALVQGAQPPEQTVIAFLVLMNNLEVAVDYIHRIVRSHIEPSRANQQQESADGAANAEETPSLSHLRSLFPLSDDATVVSTTLHSFSSSFESKANDLLIDGIQVVFNNVVKNRLRPVLADVFRDIDYQPHDDSDPIVTTAASLYDNRHGDDNDGDDPDNAELVRPRFASAWSDLVVPLSRILTPTAFDRLLTATFSYLSRLLEKRLWAYHGRVNGLGATRLERDISGIASAAVENVGGARYRHREAFARCVQIVLVMGMEEDEWEDVAAGGEGVEVVDKLSAEERARARAMVR
jgi:hypothetical protein